MRGEKQDKTLPDSTLAGHSGRESSKLPGLLERYAKAHEIALNNADYIRKCTEINSKVQAKTILKGKQKRLRDCGSYLLFRDYYTVNQVRLHKANFCMMHLLCPLCALRRAALMSVKYLERLEVIVQENPEIKPYLVTVTVKDGPSLQERFFHLKHGFESMILKRKEANRGRQEPIEMNKAQGGVYTYEIKKGKNSGEWHPHCHGIWLCAEKPYETRLSEEWKEITGDSFIVDVRPIDSGKDKLLGFVEVFSYNVKFSTMEPQDLLEAFIMLHGKRLINSFGLFRGVQIPDKLTDEPLDLPFIELLFTYVNGSGYNFTPEKK